LVSFSRLAGQRALFGRQASQRFHALGDGAVLAQKTRLGIGQRRTIGSLRQRRARLLDEGVELLIHRLNTPAKTTAGQAEV
jgi:hypothetical protein